MTRYTGNHCPVCEQAFTDEDDIVVCPDCGTPYHRACWQKVGACMHKSEHAAGFEWQPEFGPDAEKAAHEATCPNCGPHNQPGAAQCSHCGCPLPKDDGPRPDPKDEDAQVPIYARDPSTVHKPDNSRTAPGPRIDTYTDDDNGGICRREIGPEDTIDGIKAKDWAAYVGRSPMYYLMQFFRMSMTKRKVAVCLSAFLFGPAYLLYRKMWKEGLLTALLSIALSVPSLIAIVATFNPSLAYRYAEAVGEECRAGGIEVLLGPGMNIYRNSQNGRNFEYMGEDPLLASAMVAEYVKGMQSTGTVACLKHFICNETEFYRRRSNSIVDERALHELYLPPFKAGIDAGVGYVMTSYNRLNGEWAGQNADLIRRILRGELGFRGCVMSDWSSVNDTEKVVKSGQNVEMPGRKEFFGEVRALLKEGRITEKDIEKMIRPNIATSIAFGLYDREKYVPALLEKFPAHKQTGYDVAAEGIVLLRNNGILPLAEGRKILLTGRFTEQIPRTGGSTSSSAEVLGYDNVTLTAALREVYGDAVRVVEKPSREELAAADVVLLSTGTIDVESFERPFALPKEEEAFIRTAVESNPNTIVLVNSGSGIRMGGWNDKAAAVIYGWYPGQSGFTALADILSGKLSPSGKLPMTIEKEFNDSPAKGTMPAGAEFYNKAPRAYNERLIQLYDIDYKESVLVGYRWYETKGIAPLYPFGFGLSYTTFELSKPRAPKTFPADKPLKVSVTLTNTGDREGAEVVQLYVTENAPTVLRPKKELKGFRKVTLAPGKSAVVEFELDRQALAFWDTQSRGWKVNPGEYTLSLGTSSADIAATLPVSVK